MEPREFAVRTSERRKRSRQSQILRGNVIRRETKDALDHCGPNDRRDRDDDHDYQTKNRELVFEQASPCIAPQRRAVHERTRLLGHQVGLGDRHLRPDVDQLVYFWFLFRSHLYYWYRTRGSRY